MSVVAGLQRAMDGLEGAPPYGTREVLLLFASMSTCDLQDLTVEGAVEKLAERKIRVSVVSLSPEIFALKRTCVDTGGRFDVALNAHHFKELLMSHTCAPACTTRGLAPRLVRMGFPPQVQREAHSPQEACACHLEVRPQLFICPQCKGRMCSLPSRCKLCELPLVSAPLLARAFRSVVPLPRFQASDAAAGGQLRGIVCKGCRLAIEGRGRSCPSCKGSFCEVCDSFVHSILRQCPGCLEQGIERTT
eukprot:gb/GFBE01043453.1/.p1 GENE.gb/GFBE01043453.1/~~gb/GFBE01043453.1/.p1  ORF type:complete len:248 (+),score=28.86 gb/GFBE01043453.1/:1-744(+)